MQTETSVPKQMSYKQICFWDIKQGVCLCSMLQIYFISSCPDADKVGVSCFSEAGMSQDETFKKEEKKRTEQRGLNERPGSHVYGTG